MFLLPRPKVKYKEFLPHVMANMQGDTRPALPPEAAVSYIRNAAIKFAKDSLVLNHTISIATQPGMSEYPAFLGGDEERIYVVYRFDGFDWFPAHRFDNDVVTLSDVSEFANEKQEIRVAVVPRRKSCEVDELLFEEWHDAIVYEALANLHRMPQRPWTSGALSNEYRVLYNGEVGRARRLEMMGRAVGPMRVSRNPRYV